MKRYFLLFMCSIVFLCACENKENYNNDELKDEISEEYINSYSDILLNLKNDNSNEYEWIVNVQEDSVIKVVKNDNEFLITGIKEGCSTLTFSYIRISDKEELFNLIYEVDVMEDKRFTISSRNGDLNQINYILYNTLDKE